MPANAVSGVYLAHLVRNDNGGGSLIPFVVRNDASHSDIVVQTSDETWQAYNTYGGNSLYSCTVSCPPGNPGGYKGAFKVSYNRPINGDDDQGARLALLRRVPDDPVPGGERLRRQLHQRSGLVDAAAPLLLNHKVFMSVRPRRVLVR